MIGSTRQFLRFFMVAVALCASSLNGYSAVLEAFESHTHGPMGAHVHHAHDGDHAHDGVSDGVSVDADHAGHDHAAHPGQACDEAGCDEPQDEPKSASHCAYMHTHCCASFAVPAGDCTLKLGTPVRAIVPERASLIPPGQLASPLFRPPRAIA